MTQGHNAPKDHKHRIDSRVGQLIGSVSTMILVSLLLISTHHGDNGGLLFNTMERTSHPTFLFVFSLFGTKSCRRRQTYRQSRVEYTCTTPS